MKKRGMTLIEIVVASGIFMMMMGMIVGSFVTFVGAKSLSIRMKNSQEKIRIAVEMISRLSRQADVVNVIEGSTEKRLVLYTNPSGDNNNTKLGAQFVINNAGGFYYLECSSNCNGFESFNATNGQNLLGDIQLNFANSYLHRAFNNGLPFLDINLDSTSGTSTNIYYSDSFKVHTSVILKETY